MTRVVSRLYTDYFPTDNVFEKYGSMSEELSHGDKEKEQSHVAPMHGNSDVTAKRNALQGTRSKRIFVARIPSSVTEAELRKHFEAYGTVEDAYRPRDFSKNTFRGIGFVTFADPAAVDRVIGMKHALGGANVVVDRATPKEKAPSGANATSGSMTRTESGPVETQRQNKHVDSGDETVRAFPSAEACANNYPTTALLNAFNEQAFDLNFFNCISGTAAYPNSTGNNNRGPSSNISDEYLNEPMAQSSGLASGDVYDIAIVPGAAAAASVHGMNSTAVTKSGAATTTTVDAAVKLAKSSGLSPRVQSVHVSPTTTTTQNEKSPKTVTDNFAHVRKVRGGPRIFVGKISKSTVEQDLADYFTEFGYVMDVYIPRSRENKREHRGFGFVTFETEASIKRAISQGPHTLKGAVLAIDVAVPETSPTN